MPTGRDVPAARLYGRIYPTSPAAVVIPPHVDTTNSDCRREGPAVLCMSFPRKRKSIGALWIPAQAAMTMRGGRADMPPVLSQDGGAEHPTCRDVPTYWDVPTGRDVPPARLYGRLFTPTAPAAVAIPPRRHNLNCDRARETGCGRLRGWLAVWEPWPLPMTLHLCQDIA